jgi:hypothetical protein
MTKYALVRWAPDEQWEPYEGYLSIESKSVLAMWDPEAYEMICDDRPLAQLNALQRLLEKCDGH